MHQREFKQEVQRAAMSNPLRRTLCIIASAHPFNSRAERCGAGHHLAGCGGGGVWREIIVKIIDADPNGTYLRAKSA